MKCIKKSLKNFIGQDKVICINNMYMHINQYNTLKKKQKMNFKHTIRNLDEGMLKKKLDQVESKFKTRDF
ncbi:hypothetical protein Q5M85_08265 [Paraclostridium bifermentans]|nr:hypothetical protein [Paraclostridium bifermentans]